MVGAANAHGARRAASSCCSVATSSSRRSEAKFGLPEVKRGLFPAGAGTFLGTRIPLAVALEMALTGDSIDAARAYELGLVNRWWHPDDVLDAAAGVRRADRRQRPARAWPPPRSWCAWRRPTSPRAQQRLRELAAGGVRQRGCQGRARRRSSRSARPSGGAGELDVRAAVCREYGPPEVVRVEDVPSPPLDPGHVRVRVDAAAVNFPDVLLVANQYQITVPPPFVPGSEFAGVVVEVGRRGRGRRGGRSGLREHDGRRLRRGGRRRRRRRYAHSGRRRRAPRRGVRRRPRTAYHVLRSVARLQPGEELVVLGAGGGVGLAAVQLGAVLGASVTAVASSAEKLEVAAAHGAAHARRPQGRRPAPGAARGASRAVPTSSSTRWAAISPSPRSGRCGGAAASSPSATRPA